MIQIANDEQRTILTFDRDYGELIFKKGYLPYAGVIYLRWNNYQPDEPGNYLITLLKSNRIEFYGKLTVIGYKTIRQRIFLKQ